MKKHLFTILCLFASTSFLHAQDIKPSPEESTEERKPIRIGILGSSNLNWMKPEMDALERKGMTLTVSPAVMLDFKIWKNIYFSSGLGLNFMGGKLSYPEDLIPYGADTAFETNPNKLRRYGITYLEVPLAVKIHTGDFGNWSFHGNLGANVDFRLKARAIDEYKNFKSTTYGYIHGTLLQDVNIDDRINFAAVSAHIGAGAEYAIGGNTSLTFGVGFNFGLTDILGDKQGVQGEDPVAKLRQLQLRVGVIF